MIILCAYFIKLILVKEGRKTNSVFAEYFHFYLQLITVGLLPNDNLLLLATATV